MTNWLESSALDIAQGIRDQQVSATEILNLQIARIERVNPAINALAVDRFETARVEARVADEHLATGVDVSTLPPFFGVPCTIKEFLACEDMPHTGGLLGRKDHIAREDSTVVARLKASGAIIMGSSNIPEGGLWMETHNLIYGRTKNPWNVKHTPGGSSGGEAALIAAGASPLGIGSDVGGSVRIPAAFCGITGHKPTGGLVPNTGHFPPISPAGGRYLVTGPMGRRVRDIRALLEVMAGPDGHDGACEPMIWRQKGPLDLKGLRVFPVPKPGKLSVRPEMQAVVERAALALESRGAQIETRTFPALKKSIQIWAAMLSEASDEGYDVILGCGEPAPMVRELMKVPFGRSRHSYPAAIIGAVEKLTHRFTGSMTKYIELGRVLQAELEEALGPNGVLIYPPYTRPAPRHHWAFATPFDAACTALFNVMEFPVTQVPICLSKSGLPMGVQVVGQRQNDGLTLAVAEQLELEFGGWQLAPTADLT